MTKNFFDQDFFRYVDLDLFNVYLTQKQLQPIQTPDKKADNAQVLSDYLVGISDDDADSIVQDLIVVRELASDGGVMAIMELSEDQNFKKKLSHLTSNINRVLYCLVHEPDLIEPAHKLRQIVNAANFHSRTVAKKVSPQEFKSKKAQFQLELSEFLQRVEARGANCQIDVYEFSDRVCFFAYPEDHPKSFNFYKEGKLDQDVYHPSFELIFVYYPDEQRLEISTRMRRKKLQKLFDLFNHVVLDDQNPVPDNQDTLNLDILLTDDFAFTFDPAYQIDSVMVSQIRLDNKYNRKRRVIVQVDGGSGMEELLNELKFRNLLGKNLEYNQVAQATIKLRFKQFGRSNRVTTVLTAPDGLKLNETDAHQLAKKCLKDWKLINDPNSETA